MRSKVADEARAELEKAFEALSADARFQLALEMGARDLRDHSTAHQISIRESLRQLELERQRGRAPSRCHLALLE